MGKERQAAPFRALVWKEWRESWWLLVLMAVGPAAAHLALTWFYPQGEYAQNLMALEPVVFIFFALALGAGLFASETAQGTARFQAERPVERRVVWKAKLLLPICALVAGLVIYTVVYAWLFPPEFWRKMPISKINTPMIFIGMGLYAFAATTLCSVFLDRPITAFGAGGCLAMALGIGQGLLCEKVLGIKPVIMGRYPLLPMSAVLLVEAVLLLLLSRWIYVRWTRD